MEKTKIHLDVGRIQLTAVVNLAAHISVHSNDGEIAWGVATVTRAAWFDCFICVDWLLN